MKFVVNAKELEGNAFFDRYIEKARKGEQVGGEYIYRENIEEKTTVSGGKQTVRRYRYYYVTDLLKDSAEKILKNIGNFFFKGKPEEIKKIENAYDKENIEKDYGADKKTWYQHVMEYFSHRSIWDKRFSKKETAEKFKKPIKQKVVEKIDNPEMETPVEKVPEVKTSADKKEKAKWKANPSLMRKVWSLYSGKEATKNEKAEKVVEEVINNDGLTEDERKQIESYIKKQLPKELKYAKENTDVVKEPVKNDDQNKLTPEEENAVKVGFPRFMGLEQLNTIGQYAKKGEEKEFYRGKIKEIAGAINKIKDRWYNSYDTEKEKHLAGLHLFDSNSDWYITEWDGKDEAFGYTVLNGDKEMAEWGYINLPDLQASHNKSPFNQLEVDLYYDNSGYVEDDPNISPAFEAVAIDNEESGDNKNSFEKFYEETNKKPENSAEYFTPKKVDWFQAFAGSWNKFYPNGTGGKPYSSVTRINEKGRRETIQRTANSKTDLSGVLDNVNDFVFGTEHLGERARQNFIKRLAEMGFHAQKEYTDEKGETKFMLMIRNGSKAGNVEMIPNPDYKKKEYTVITHDEAGNETDKQVFSDIDSAQAFMDKQRKALEAGESEAEKHKNRSDAMLGNQNARKYGLTDEEIVAQIKDGEWRAKMSLAGLKNKKVKPEDIERLVGSGLYGYLRNKKNIDDENYARELVTEYYRNGGKLNGSTEDNSGIERNGLSDFNDTVFNGNTETFGNQNGIEAESGTDAGEPSNSSVESGIGLRKRQSESGNSGDSISVGRLGKAAAKKIREQCREILKKPDSEITEEDKLILAQYEGAGGLNEGNQSDAAVLSEFYTPRDVIKKVWELVDKYNPNKDKKVIEPSAGTGRFAENRTENFTLCELDEISARIAHLLHPKADVKQGAFQKLFMKNNAVLKEYKGEKYDVAVGNPPYGDYTGRYKGMGEGKVHTRYEEYFIDRTLDTLKDGGIMAFVVPSGFLRNASSKAKEEIAKKGKLLEAWRLPKGTFSSTDVGTDIVVIRKEPGNASDFANNDYFEKNASHIIGYETNDGNWGSTVVNLPEGKTVAEAIDMIDPNAVEFVQQIKSAAEQVEIKKTESAKVVRNELAETDSEKHKNRSEAMKGNKNAEKLVHKEKVKKAKKGDVYTPSEGHIMSANEFAKRFGKEVPEEDLKFWKKNNWEGIIEKSSLTVEEIKELDKNKNFLRTVNGDYISTVNYASGNIYKKLDELEANKNVYNNKDFYGDKDYEFRKALLMAALPEKKTLQQVNVGVTANFAKTFRDSEGKSLVEKFLFDYCGFKPNGSTWGITVSDNELEENLSWNDIWDYIHQVPVRTQSSRDPAEQETNKMIAEQKKQSRRECAERLFNEFLRRLPEDEQKEIAEAWNKQFNAFVNPDFKKIPLFIEGLSTHKGKKEFNPTVQQMKGISELCNKGNGILAYDVGVGKTFCGITATVNQLETGKAKKPLIMVPKAVYKKWIKEIHQHFPEMQVNELGNFSEKIIGQYKNADGTFSLPENAINICTYDALQKITFKDETIDGQLRDDMLDSQSIYDYDENGNLVADTRTAREKASLGEKIDKMLGKSVKAKEGAVFWEDLGIDHITVDELHNFKNVFSIPRNIGKSTRSTNEKKKDYFGRTIKADDDPGKLSNEFQGLSGASSSRAMKLFAISQLIQRENDGKGFFGLSATPFNNSPIEIYNILSLVARNRLKDLQIYNLQDFLREFAELKPDWKVDAKGNTTQSQTMKNFKNLAALQNLITEFIDKVDGEEAGVVRPRKVTHRPELDLNEIQKKILEVEKMRMDGKFSKRGENGKPTGDTLVAMNNMRMATLSPALIDPKFYADYKSVYPDLEIPKSKDVVKSSPKLTFVCDTVAEQYKARPDEGQVIYMPRGTDSYQYLKDYLVSKGMPADSIAFMNADTTLENKERITEDFNDPDGKIKVIIGSETIKEGVSLNGNSTTIYNTMLGWNPTETTQVEGRIWRQGNKQGITHIVYPLMNDSIDSMMMQKYDEKSSRLNALWSYKGDSLNVEDYDPEEVKFELIKDPEKRANLRILQQQADLKKELRISNALYDNIYDSKKNYENYQVQIEHYVEGMPEAEKKVDDKKALYEEKKSALDKAKKSLASAKKAKDNDLIELAEEKIKQAEKEAIWAKNDYDAQKSAMRMYEKNLKDLRNQASAIEAYWEKQGVDSVDKIDGKIQQISEKRHDLQTKIDELKEKKNEYVKIETQKLAEEAARIKHDSVEDVVKQTVKNIGSNLRLMDDELRAEIYGELVQKYPHLKKALPLFFVRNGRMFLNKGYLQ